MRLTRVAIGATILGLLAGGAFAADRDKEEKLSAAVQRVASGAKATLVPQVVQALKVGESVAVRDLKPMAPAAPAPEADREMNEVNEERIKPLVPGDGRGDAAVQADMPAPNMPAPTLTFDGQSNADNFVAFGGRLYPPDTNGDVGLTQYVQTVNLLFRVYNKTTGVPVTPPTKMSSLFTSIGGICSTNDNGDPIVLYDHLADRWLLSQFAFTGLSTPPYHQCVAISKTGDATGAYWVFDFVMPDSNFNDYPHFGVWPDGYYMMDHQFFLGGSFSGSGAFAYNRAKMLVGDPTSNYIYFNLNLLDPTIGGLLPSDLDGPPPPVGTPNYFSYPVATEFGDALDGLRVFAFHVDFATPASSTFTEVTGSPFPVAAYDPVMCGFARACIPQPAPATTGQYLDAISDRLMHRMQYRNFSTYESLVISETVDANSLDHAGPRYYQLRRNLPAGTFTVAEQATFAPDADHRWMPSAAMDNQGNLAVGYSVSSTTTFPSIRYAGRLASDPPNGLFQGEATLVTGAGVQQGTANRWGDYSGLTVDPTNDCTFYYTTEYYTATGELCPTTTTTICWKTKIGYFTFPGCTAPATGTLTGLVTDAATTLPINGATVATSTGYVRITGATGTYTMTLPVGTYTVTASAPSYAPQTASVTITAGGTTTRNFALVGGGPTLVYQSSAVDDSTTGNNNGHIDQNECVNLNVTLMNTGGTAATGISATLSTTTTGVTVSTATSAYPNIPAGGTGTNSTPFQISTSPTFVPGTPIAFSLAITTAQGPFTVTFSVPTGAPGTPVDFLYTGPPVPIPDANPTGAFIDIPVTGLTANTAKVTFTVYINHTWDSDLALTLAGPGGSPIVPLATNEGGAGDNFGTDCPADANDTTFDDAAATPIGSGTAPFAGSFRPETPLNVFNGASGNGTWRFKAVDSAGADTGNINCAKLTITPFTGTPGPGACGGVTTGKFYTLTPCRVADTRNPPGPSGGPALAANTTRNFPVKGICGVPTDATSVAISLTVVQETDTGDLRLYPQGATAPLASTINFAVNHVRANNAIIPLGAGPTNGISVQCDMPTGSTGTTHFLFDVFGYFK